MKKKILSTIVIMVLTMAFFAIPAYADAVLKGKTFDAYTDFSAGAPSTSAPEGYVYAGYRVEQVNNLYSTVTNLFVLETETPMILHYTQGNSGYTISIPGGTYYKNYITYDKNGERNKSETPMKQNATSFAIGTNMAFYPALKMINSATGEELDPNGNGVFTLHAFLDSNAVYHFSVSCDDPGYDYFNAKVQFYHINGSFAPPVSATYTDSGDYSKPASYSSVATSEKDFAYYDQYFNKFSRANLQPLLSGVDGDGSQGYIYTQHDLTSGSSASSSFDPELYQPYQSRGAFGFDTLYGIGVTPDATYNIKSLSMYDGKSWYPTSDNFGLVAVVKQEGKADIVLYYKFSRSAALAARAKWIVTPIMAPTIEAPEEEVTDLQTLADYIKYLATVTNNNNTTIYNNYTNELSDIPWSDYVYGGLQQWLPELSYEFDTVFNGLFEDYFVPDLTEIEGEIDEQEDALRDKFEWVTVVKREVNFITTSIGESGDNVPVFRIYIDKWGITDSITIFDGSWINPTTRMKVKDVITLFCTISLVMFIFRTLPSTIGRVPNE